MPKPVSGEPMTEAAAPPAKPEPIWMKPIIAEAEPAICGKGARAAVTIEGVSKAMPIVATATGPMIERKDGGIRNTDSRMRRPPAAEKTETEDDRTTVTQSRCDITQGNGAEEISTSLHQHANTESGGCHADLVDEDEGQHGGLRIKRADRPAEHQCGQKKTRRAQQGPIGRQEAARADQALVRDRRLAQKNHDGEDGQSSEAGHEEKYRLPAKSRK